jgi:hypothetical protein
MAAWLKEHIPMATVESFKTAASDTDDKHSKKSNGMKRRGSGLLKASGLVTLLGIGAGVTMLMLHQKIKINTVRAIEASKIPTVLVIVSPLTGMTLKKLM